MFLGDVLPGKPTNILTTRVGFNVNANAGPGLTAIEVALLSFDVRFQIEHAASFDLTFDFLLRGQLQRVADQEWMGSMLLGDISIPTLVRLSDGAEFPLGATLAGASLDLDATTTGINLAGQDNRTLSFRDQTVGTTDYQLTFLVSATALSQSCEVSARFGADNGSTTGCDACVYPGFGERVRDDDGLFITLTVTTLCGDVRLDPGEQCDFGPLNGVDESCCDAFCRFAPASQVCRPAAGECDQSETCSGQSDGCPPDLAKSAGSPCTADSSACTDDVCDAGGVCAHPLRAGTTCDDQGVCTCDHDGLFCTGPVRCGPGGGLCIVLPTPCAEDDTCDEENDVCVSPFGTVTPSATSSPSPSSTTPGRADTDRDADPERHQRHPRLADADFDAVRDRHPPAPGHADLDTDRLRDLRRRLQWQRRGRGQRARARRQHRARQSTRLGMPALRRRSRRPHCHQRADRRRQQPSRRLPDLMRPIGGNQSPRLRGDRRHAGRATILRIVEESPAACASSTTRTGLSGSR